MFNEFVEFVRSLYLTDESIPLHAPIFAGNERKYVLDAIESTYVSSVGGYVDKLERRVENFTGAGFAVATVNGTSALHVGLLLAGVTAGDEVVTQSLTFAATSAAIRYCLAEPVFIDIDRQTLGMSADCLEQFLHDNAEIQDGVCRNRRTGSIIRACVPMHTFGHPAKIDGIARVCREYHIALVEDAAESLGSLYNEVPTGRFGVMAVFSFNGNKTITTGGGGMLITDDGELARKAKHLTTTAKITHPWEYRHDTVGFNYRMPNLNAALGLGQMEQLPDFLVIKRKLAERYKLWCERHGWEFFPEPQGARANYWLNSLIMPSQQERDEFIAFTNSNNVMTRPAWTPMHLLPMYRHCQHADLSVTEWIADRLVNIPSSVPAHEIT